MYFLKYAEDLEARPTEFDHDRELCPAFDAANAANLNKREIELYDDSVRLIRDQYGRIAYAWDKGIQQGHAQGRQEGLQEGLEKAASALAQRGFSIAEIAAALQLTESEVAQILQ